jgi:hypothetical protein
MLNRMSDQLQAEIGSMEDEDLSSVHSTNSARQPELVLLKRRQTKILARNEISFKEKLLSQT